MWYSGAQGTFIYEKKTWSRKSRVRLPLNNYSVSGSKFCYSCNRASPPRRSREVLKECETFGNALIWAFKLIIFRLSLKILGWTFFQLIYHSKRRITSGMEERQPLSRCWLMRDGGGAISTTIKCVLLFFYSSSDLSFFSITFVSWAQIHSHFMGVISRYSVGLKSAQALGCPSSVKCLFEDIGSALTPSLMFT